MRLDQALNRRRTPVQARFGTVTAVNPGICTVKVAGGEIPVIYLKGGAPSVGDFVRVHRQGVVSYLLNPSSGALWVGDSGLDGIWRVPTSGQNPVFYSYSPPTGVVEGPDTAIWASGYTGYGGYVYRMVSSGPNIGNATEITLTLPSGTPANPTGICVGPDKNLWLSDLSGGVWKVTTGFAATFYPLTNSAPLAICTGPDGDLWVADGGATHPGVWRVSTSGAGTLFPLTGSGPESITTGPDGNLWIASNPYSGTVGVWLVTTDGAGTPFALAGSAPRGITSGPLSSLWVADANGDVWKVSTAGVGVPYPLTGIAFPNPLAICVGSDSNLWVADGNGYAWKVTPQGVGTPYSLPNSSPTSICTGP